VPHLSEHSPSSCLQERQPPRFFFADPPESNCRNEALFPEFCCSCILTTSSPEAASPSPVASHRSAGIVASCSQTSSFTYLGTPRWPRARLTVALPRARPTPRPRVPRDLNIGAFLREDRQHLSLLPEAQPSSPQHIRNDKQAHVRATNVHAVQVGDSAVALRDVNVLHLYVHVVLGCRYD
jgi:hypothetical protein